MGKLPFVGEPKPADEVERGGRQRYEWAEIFAAVKPGEARQIAVKYDTADNARIRLEKEGVIKTGEYRVRSRGSGENRVTWIIRRSPT